MQSDKRSATVPVALFGVSPNRWGGRLHSPIGASSRLLPARRRAADGSGRDPSSVAVLRRVDDRAAHLQLHRSGSVANAPWPKVPELPDTPGVNVDRSHGPETNRRPSGD